MSHSPGDGLAGWFWSFPTTNAAATARTSNPCPHWHFAAPSSALPFFCAVTALCPWPLHRQRFPAWTIFTVGSLPQCFPCQSGQARVEAPLKPKEDWLAVSCSNLSHQDTVLLKSCCCHDCCSGKEGDTSRIMPESHFDCEMGTKNTQAISLWLYSTCLNPQP